MLVRLPQRCAGYTTKSLVMGQQNICFFFEKPRTSISFHGWGIEYKAGLEISLKEASFRKNVCWVPVCLIPHDEVVSNPSNLPFTTCSESDLLP